MLLFLPTFCFFACALIKSSGSSNYILTLLLEQADRRARLRVSLHECGATPKYARAYDAREGAFFFWLG